jgi:hypothetical protein
MLTVQTLSYTSEDKNKMINDYREVTRKFIGQATILAEQIERSLKQNFGVVNPYKAQA